MGTMIYKGKIYITVEEIINYLKGMRMDLETIFEKNKKDVAQKVEHPELQKIINKLDSDNFNLFFMKLDNTLEDLRRHLNYAIQSMSIKKDKKKTNCEQCNKTYASRSTLFDLVGEDGIYHFYCKDCIRPKVEEANIFDDNKKIKNLNNKELKKTMQFINTAIMNKIFSDPIKLQKIKESKPYKEIMEEITKAQKTTTTS